MAHHAAGKEGGRVDENLQVHIHFLIGVVLEQQVDHREERYQNDRDPDPPVVPSGVIKTQNERHEVKGQREDP